MSVQFEQKEQIERIKQIVKKIEDGEKVDKKDLEFDVNDKKDTPFLYACWYSTNVTLIKVLNKMKELQFTDDEIKGQKNVQGYSGLHVAAGSPIDALEKVKTLVENYGFDVNKSADKEVHTIKRDTGKYVNEFPGIPYEKIPQKVRIIDPTKKNNGANENHIDVELTPLQIARTQGNDDVIKYLKNNGAINSNSVGGKRTKKRKLNKRKKTQKKLKKKTRKQKKSKRKTTKRK